MNGILSPSHLWTVAVAAILFLTLSLVPRKLSPRANAGIAWLLAVIVIGNEIVYFAQFAVRGDWAPQYGLPLYLCDAAAFAGGLACVFRTQILVEITYFWAFAGTLQGLLTPDIDKPPLSYFWDQYYIDHIGVMACAFFLIIGLRYKPRKHAMWTVFWITLVFTVADGIVDWLTHSNYMYLQSVPSTGSLLNYFGPWPWYMVTAAVVAIVFFVILDMPFWHGRTREGKQASSSLQGSEGA